MKLIAKALKRIVIGYLFIVFNFNIGTLDIVPNFVGYILIYQALNTLQGELEHYALLKNFSVILGIVAFVNWIFAFLSIIPLSLIVFIITLCFDYLLFTDIISIAQKYHYNRSSLDYMKWLRNARVILFVISNVVSLLFANAQVNLFLIYILSFIVHILCIVSINTISNDLNRRMETA